MSDALLLSPAISRRRRIALLLLVYFVGFPVILVSGSKGNKAPHVVVTEEEEEDAQSNSSSNINSNNSSGDEKETTNDSNADKWKATTSHSATSRHTQTEPSRISYNSYSTVLRKPKHHHSPASSTVDNVVPDAQTLTINLQGTKAENGLEDFSALSSVATNGDTVEPGATSDENDKASGDSLSPNHDDQSAARQHAYINKHNNINRPPRLPQTTPQQQAPFSLFHNSANKRQQQPNITTPSAAAVILEKIDETEQNEPLDDSNERY